MVTKQCFETLAQTCSTSSLVMTLLYTFIKHLYILCDNLIGFNLIVYQLRVKRNYLTKLLFDRCTGMLNGRYGRVQESQIVLTAEGTGGGELAET